MYMETHLHFKLGLLINKFKFTWKLRYTEVKVQAVLLIASYKGHSSQVKF